MPSGIPSPNPKKPGTVHCYYIPRRSSTRNFSEKAAARVVCACLRSGGSKKRIEELIDAQCGTRVRVAPDDPLPILERAVEDFDTLTQSTEGLVDYWGTKTAAIAALLAAWFALWMKAKMDSMKTIKLGPKMYLEIDATRLAALAAMQRSSEKAHRMIMDAEVLSLEQKTNLSRIEARRRTIMGTVATIKIRGK